MALYDWIFCKFIPLININIMKRMWIATISGLIFGFVCNGFASSGGNDISIWLSLSIITSRTLLGFGIGISKFKVHWVLNGIIMGIIFSIPSAFGSMMGPENPEFPPSMIAISTIVMGMIYGFLIELITSIIFRAKT